MPVKVEPLSVMVVFKGEVRLSPDLIISPQFYPVPQARSVSIKLLSTKLPPQNGVKKVYYTNERAKSGRISLGNEIRILGLDPVKLRGKVFSAKIEGTAVVINFGRCTNGKNKKAVKDRSKRTGT